MTLSFLKAQFGAVVWSAAPPITLPPFLLLQEPVPAHQGMFSQRSILEAAQRKACGRAVCRHTQIPVCRGSDCRAAPAAGRGGMREYTDRLMAAVDAAQLDFTSPLLTELATLPCSQTRLSSSSREPWDELSPFEISPRVISNPSCPCPAPQTPGCPQRPCRVLCEPRLLRLQVNKAPADFIALLGFVPLCYSPRLNLLPWRQELAQPELPRRSGGTVTLSGCLT